MDEDAKFNRRVALIAAGGAVVTTTVLFKFMPAPARVRFPEAGHQVNLCFNVYERPSDQA